MSQYQSLHELWTYFPERTYATQLNISKETHILLEGMLYRTITARIGLRQSFLAFAGITGFFDFTIHALINFYLFLRQDCEM